MTAIISEIRYRNGPGFQPNQDYIEIRVPTGDDVSGLSVDVYNTNGSLRSSTDLSNATMTTVGNFDYYVVTAPINRFGAVSLTENGNVLSFVSFDREVTANEGAADGLTSTQVGTNGNDSTSSLSSRDGVNFFVDPNPNPGAPCFTTGTRIMTDKGEVPIEDLQPGDRVLTHNGRYEELRLVLSRTLRTSELMKMPKLRPVRILAGALGQDLPRRDLLVSRQHRMLTSSPIARRMFGEDTVLISAIHLTALPGVCLDDQLPSITYYHLIFETHVVLFAEGAPSESLFLGPHALGTLPREALQEVLTLFPDLSENSTMPSSCHIPSNKRQKKLIARHVSNNKPLLCRASARNSELLDQNR